MFIADTDWTAADEASYREGIRVLFSGDAGSPARADASQTFGLGQAAAGGASAGAGRRGLAPQREAETGLTNTDTGTSSTATVKAGADAPDAGAFL